MDFEEDYHKYITALWFWSMNLTSKVFIMWNCYTKYKKQKRLREAIHKSRNCLDWIDNLNTYQEYFKDNDICEADLHFLNESFTENTCKDLFKPFCDISNASDKEKTNIENDVMQCLAIKLLDSPGTTSLSEDLKSFGHNLFQEIKTPSDGQSVKEMNVSVSGGCDTASVKEVEGQESEILEDFEQDSTEENKGNLIVNVAEGECEDDSFRKQHEKEEKKDDNQDNDVDGDNADDNVISKDCDGNQDDNLHQEEEEGKVAKCSEGTAKHAAAADDDDKDDDSKDNCDEDNNEDDDDNIDDDDDECGDSEYGGDGDNINDDSKVDIKNNDLSQVSSKENVKILLEEDTKATRPAMDQFKGGMNLNMVQPLNTNNFSLIIELICPERQVCLKSNVDANVVADDKPSMRDTLVQTEINSEDILKNFVPPLDKSHWTFAMPPPLLLSMGSNSKRLVPPDAFSSAEKDKSLFASDHSIDTTSSDVKHVEKRSSFHQIVPKQLKHIIEDAFKTRHAKFNGKTNTFKLTSGFPSPEEIMSRFETQQCYSEKFQKAYGGTEIRLNPQNVKRVNDEHDYEDRNDLLSSKSGHLSGIPLMMGHFLQFQNNSENNLTHNQFNGRSWSDEKTCQKGDIISKLCSIFKNTSMHSDQSFMDSLSQNYNIESVEKIHSQQNLSGTPSGDLDKRNDDGNDDESNFKIMNDDCLNELEQIRMRLKDFQELKKKLEHALEIHEQLMEIINCKTHAGDDSHHSMNVQLLLEKVKNEISALTLAYHREESKCILIAKRAKHLLNQMYI